MLTKFQKYVKPGLIAFTVLFVILGIWLRFNNIANCGFIFYDEGYYINDDRRDFVEIVRKSYPHSFEETMRIIYGNFRISLASGKALWIFLVNLSAVTYVDDDFSLARLISAVFGCLTLGVVYLFAGRYFKSWKIGLLSVILLAIMPSHVFYSRCGLQEVLSTFCFLLGFYFYLFPRKLGWRTFLSSFFFMLTYFSNYRMIVLPALVGFCELYTYLRFKEMPDFRKLMWNTLAFLLLIFGIGSFDQGQHLKVIMPWMLHQVHLAEHEPFRWYNLLSYPYFTFRLETFFFGLFFWANLYYAFRKKWEQLYPFFQVLVQMVIFSFPEEKGARYVAVVYPFMAMSVASFLVHILEEGKEKFFRWAIVVCAVLMLGAMTAKSWVLAHSHFNYRQAMEYILKIDKNVKVVSSQKWVMDLYTNKPDNVQDLPHTFPQMLKMFSLGYRYLVLDPQTYISWGKGGQRFNTELDNYLEFVIKGIRPIKVFPHLDNEVFLERFVFEHNEDLLQSIKFMKVAQEEELGAIRIYDMAPPITNIIKIMSARDSQPAGSLTPQ